MARVIRERDWSQTPLGPIDSWPPALRMAISLCLDSKFPISLAWGPSRTQIYNDGYWPICGAKHPEAMGADFKECWASAWPVIGHAFEQAESGHASFLENTRMYLDRHGYLEETFFTYSFSPIRDAKGVVRGVFHPVTEVTQQTLAERRVDVLRAVATRSSGARTVKAAIAEFLAALADYSLDVPFALVYLYDGPGHGATLAGAAGMLPGSALAGWPLPEPILKAEVQELPERCGSVECGPYPEPPRIAMLLPIGVSGAAGVLIAGVSARRALDQPYRLFYEMLSGALSNVISTALSHEQEMERADSLKEIDRAKTAFFSNVSHEFRTPLTLILGPVEELLARNGERSAEDTTLLQVVRRNGQRLKRMVDSLLQFMRIESGRPVGQFEPVDVGSLTADLASGFRAGAEQAGLAYSVVSPPLSRPLHVDPGLWEQVVFNLLSNALKYTREGSITVRLTEHESEVELAVVDTGIGIAEDELERIFDRFHRVEGVNGRTCDGTGIGLALVKELVRLHGGSVRVESVLGVGSTFLVSLPFGEAHLPPDRVHSKARPAADRVRDGIFSGIELPVSEELGEQPAIPRAHVLVADDNADMRAYLKRLLAPHYQVTLVADGKQALAAALQSPPDLVLTDVMMPEKDGFSLLQDLRAHPATRCTPVVILSARAGEEACAGSMRAGADDYLIKPFAPHELVARVAAHVALSRQRRRVEAQLTEVFLQAPVAVAVLRGEEMIYEMANRAYRSLLSGRELLGRRLVDAVPELTSRNHHILQEVYHTGRPFTATEFYVELDRDGDGQLEDSWFDVVYHPLRTSAGDVTGIIAVAMDVTAPVQARRELERLNEELEQFAFSAGHDLREPLRMVNSYSQLLVRRFSSLADPDVLKYTAQIRKSVMRMEALVGDLLAYASAIHREQDEPAPCDLNRVMAEALQILDLQVHEAGATITSGPLPRVLGLERQLVLVFQNVLANACKYCTSKPVIHVEAQKKGAFWVVSFRDNGIGFDPANAEEIFGLFRRLHAHEYPGTGLGLSICRRIVERWGGDICASSQGEGFGAEFLLTLRSVPE